MPTKKILIFILLTRLCFAEPRVGEASMNGKVSSATIAWTAVGIAFLIAVGITIAVSLSHDNK